MTSPFDLNSLDLAVLSIKDYFKTIESAIDKDESVEKVTNFFTEQPFSEFKSYLNRRRLKPIDTRFDQIELVYNDKNKISAIVWDLNLLLSQLIEIFGTPIIHNEPYSNSTAFAFKSTNPNIDIIKTRHPEWLKKITDRNSYEYNDKNNQKVELSDPDFSFIQFNLAD